ncbi:hypothetical protein FPRO04_14151 [Fusarium proliferatum]|nr:hypothetical protein FPRO04_14151 [Fusarium proliferatum]
MFYWILNLSSYDGIPEYGVKTWLSEDFRLLVNMAPLGQKIRTERHKWERKLISTGILDHATVIKKNDSRWKRARFAYLRASILWESHDLAVGVSACGWAQVSWDGTGAQHEDHLYNWRHIALAWYVRDGKPLEEELRTGRLNIVDHFRPNQVPTGRDLSAILNYSWDLWTLETDFLKSPHAKRAAIVDKALDVYHRGVEAVVTTAEPIFLDPTVEASYQQLLHAAASTAFDTGDFLRAKALYEAHLATSPATTDFKMLNLIRRKQLQSLIEWHMCVYIIARCMGDVDDKAMRGLMRSFLDMIEDSGKPGGLPKALAKVMKEHSEEFGKKRVRDDVASFGLQREPETVKKFGWFARRLLEEPLYVVYADVFDKEVRDPDNVLDDLSEAGAAASISGEARGRIVVERIGECLTSTVKAMKRSGVQAAPDTVPIIMSLSDLESAMHMYAGNPTRTAATLRKEVAREALSSTTNTGWQRLAELHMLSYMSAVKETAEPDYKKGLTHLNKWWNLHQGQEISKRSQCCALIDFMT